MAADPDRALALLREGELRIHGQLTEASNAAFYCTVGDGEQEAVCVYKPVRGERPLWDFPDGTLAGREVAAYQVSAATGWHLVPPTVLREGPYGEGMCQVWVESDPEAGLLALQDTEEPEPGWCAIGRADVGGGRTALLVHADDPRLRRLAVLDSVLNNGDRKGGHLLPAVDGRIYGIDHGVTFAVPGKLRTLLWGWAGQPLPDEAVEALTGLRRQLAEGDGGADGGGLAERLRELITDAEVGAVRERVASLLDTGLHPLPSGDWPAVPWPPI
ncbi:SCO1664 family protein [Streptacidiphilus sp. P02-A3a]|nr:SCO1664 family protein [Streptacidiphilus sp. P02-A3a]QMU73830.1 SCO1664 family protein [Streptacidiphilus sp. P02-A3a]